MVEKEPARVCRFFCAITVQMKTVFNTWDIGKCSYKNLGFYNPSTVSVEESVVPVESVVPLPEESDALSGELSVELSEPESDEVSDVVSVISEVELELSLAGVLNSPFAIASL